jgi:battenin
VNTFYHLSSVSSSEDGSEGGEGHRETPQEREFKIGSMGFADSTGILLASMISIPVEVGLCELQVRRGKGICREL